MRQLLPDDVAQGAYESLMDRPRTTENASRHEFTRDPWVLACFRKDVCSVAQQLAGYRGALKPPSVVYTITVFPTDIQWEWPAPHIDHSLEKDGHRTFPEPFRVGCLIYLNDVPSHSGATVVWPGSHRQLEALAAAHPQEYEYLAPLNREIHRLALQSPIEVTTVAGDVLFYHYLCAHAGSANTGSWPRVALNHKW